MIISADPRQYITMFREIEPCDNLPAMKQSPTAAQLVLSIPEILEQILLSLFMKDVFVFQRINKTWRDTIQNSPSLQRKLFLTPWSPVGETTPIDLNE